MLNKVSEFMKDNEKFVIGTILGLSTVLRLVAIGQSFWLDEAINVTAAQSMSLKDLLLNYSVGDFHPPLFHIVLWGWLKIIPTTELFARLPSLIFGVSTVFLTYLIGRHIFLKRSKLYSLIAAFLLATSSLHIYYSQEARMYSLAAFLTALVFFALLKLKSQKSFKTTIFFIASLMLMLLSDYQPWLLLPLLLWVAPGITSLGVLTTLPWWPKIFEQFEAGLSTAKAFPGWELVVGKLTAKQIVLVPVKFLIGRVSFDNDLLYITMMFIPILVSIILIAKSATSRRWKTNLIIGWLFIPFLIGIIISLKVPIFSYFRFLFTLPAFYLLLTYGLSTLRKKQAVVILILLIFINLTSSGVYLFNQKFHRENWKDAANYLQKLDEGKTLIVFPNKAQSAPLDFYTQGKYLIKDKDSMYLAQRPETVISVKYVSEIFDPENQIHDTLISNSFEKEKEISFRGVVFWQYKKK